MHCSYLPPQKWTNSINFTFKQLREMSFRCDNKKTPSKPQPFKREKAITKTACEVSGVGSSSSKSRIKLLTHYRLSS